jgi:hypothetical protein
MIINYSSLKNSVESGISIGSSTLIYFTTNSDVQEVLKNSYVYVVPTDLSSFVYDLRRFDIVNFPIICYDDQNMELASKAHWVFESIEYFSVVLYGSLENFKTQGAATTPNNLGPIKFSEILMEINLNQLSNVHSDEYVVQELSLPLYTTIGTVCTVEKVQEYLELNEINTVNKDSVITGENSAVLGILLKFCGLKGIKVFLGEWASIHPNRDSSKTEGFFSMVGSVYYDPIEEKHSDSETELTRERTVTFKDPDPDHYNNHLMIEKTKKKYKEDRLDSVNKCKMCYLL